MVGLRDRDYTSSGTRVPYVQFGRVFYIPTSACSRGYKLRSREGVCPRSLSLVMSCDAQWECDCVVLAVFVVAFCVHPPYVQHRPPFYSPRGLVYMG
jgi:hypothetical protein